MEEAGAEAQAAEEGRADAGDGARAHRAALPLDRAAMPELSRLGRGDEDLEPRVADECPAGPVGAGDVREPDVQGLAVAVHVRARDARISKQEFIATGNCLYTYSVLLWYLRRRTHKKIRKHATESVGLAQ